MSERAGREPFGIFYGWWRGDPLPTNARPANLTIERLDDEPLPAIASLDPANAIALLQEGHRLYIARVGNEIVGHGWAATVTASIGELGVELRLAPRERYLWGFETQPAWRGQGVYTALIQAMLVQEDADRFWIGHDSGNDPSAHGILKAGFIPVGEAYLGTDGTLRYARYGNDARSRAAQDLLGMPSEDE